MTFKLDLSEKDFALLIKLLIETGDLVINRPDRDRILMLLNAIHQNNVEGKSFTIKIASDLLNFLIKVMDFSDKISQELGCQARELENLAVSICMQIQSQNLDNWKLK